MTREGQVVRERRMTNSNRRMTSGGFSIQWTVIRKQGELREWSISCEYYPFGIAYDQMFLLYDEDRMITSRYHVYVNTVKSTLDTTRVAPNCRQDSLNY